MAGQGARSVSLNKLQKMLHFFKKKKKKNTLTLAWPLLIFVSFKIRSPHVLIKFQIIISQTLGHLSRLYIVTLSDLRYDMVRI